MIKKIVSSVLIAGQMGIAGGAMAATPTVTPEFKLVQASIALSGLNLSTEQAQGRISQAFTEYQKTAQPDGQMDRLEQALVDLNVYGTEQAHELAVQAQSFSSKLGSGDSQANATQAVVTEMSLLASKYPAGAQFKACDLASVIWIGAGATAIAGGFVWSLGAEANTDPYGNNIPDPKEVRVGEIMTASAAVAILDATLIYMLSDKQCDL